MTPQELLNQTVELIKAVYKNAKQKEQAELAEVSLQIRENLQTIRDMFLVLEEANRSLEERVTELQRSLTLQHELVRHMGVYWRQGDPDPWCPTCWETEQTAIHLNPSGIMAGRLFVCPRCNYDILLDNIAPPDWKKLNRE